MYLLSYEVRGGNCQIQFKSLFDLRSWLRKADHDVFDHLSISKIIKEEK